MSQSLPALPKNQSTTRAPLSRLCPPRTQTALVLLKHRSEVRETQSPLRIPSETKEALVLPKRQSDTKEAMCCPPRTQTGKRGALLMSMGMSLILISLLKNRPDGKETRFLQRIRSERNKVQALL